MKFIENLLSSEVVQALGWTILHSLWQGILVALILGVLMLLLHKHSSTVRYFVSVTALITVLLLSAVTFFGLYDSLKQPLPTEITGVKYKIIPNIGTGHTYYQIPENEGFWNSLTTFIDYFNTHLPLIVTIWMMGVAVLALRLLGGLAYVQRLKSYRTKLLPEKWQNRMQDMATNLNIKQELSLLESCFVKVPMVIGHLKPIILLPVGTITGLSVKQVEAILAHELAHIARNDYLVNIFQSVVDVIFFYHPAVWWISANIRSERENCCDDIAVSLSEDRLAVANALANLESITWSTPNMAMAATGKGGKLFNRVKRLVEAKSTNPTFKEGFIAACVLMVSILSLSFSAGKNYEGKTAEAQEVWVEKEIPMVAGSSKAVAPGIIGQVSQNKITKGQQTDQDVVQSQGNHIEREVYATATASSSSEFPFGSKNSNFALPSKITEVDTTKNGIVYRPNQTLSTTLENGKYVFVRFDDKGEIAEMFVEGKKVPKRDFKEYKSQLEKKMSIVDVAREYEERKRAIEQAIREVEISREQAISRSRREVERAMREVEKQRLRAREDWDEEIEKALRERKKEIEKARAEWGKNYGQSWEGSVDQLREMNFNFSDSNFRFNFSDSNSIFNFVMPQVPSPPNVLFCDSMTFWNGGIFDVESLESLEQLEELGSFENFHQLEHLGQLKQLKNLEKLKHLEHLKNLENHFDIHWSFNDIHDELLEELKEDGFEPKRNGSYKFDIDGEKLVINGKKQSDEIFRKYKEIIELETGNKLKKGNHYIFTIED